MKHGIVLLLMLSLPVLGGPKRSAKMPASSVTKLLIQMEHDWLHASNTNDIVTMDRIIADDWVSVDFQGKTVTKAQAMADLRLATPAVQAAGPGEMKVRVFGTTAIVTGRDSSGKYAWMDVFLKRDGRWQAVASQSTKVEK